MASCRCLNLWFRFCVNLDIPVVLGHVLSCSQERSAPAPLLSVFLMLVAFRLALMPLGAAEGELGWPRVCRLLLDFTNGSRVWRVLAHP